MSEFIHVRNLEKYHPGYKDRTLVWAKIYFNMAQGDPDCEMIEDETDWGRLIKFILLELQARKPIPLNEQYLIKKGFNLEKRPITLTLKMLHNFIDVVTEDSELRVLEKIREEEEKRREDDKKPEVDEYENIKILWNEFAENNKLSTIMKLSPKRYAGVKSRLKEPEFNIEQIFKEIYYSDFLHGINDHKWKVDFDFIFLSPNNYLKILEGKYRNNGNGKHTTEPNKQSFEPTSDVMKDLLNGTLGTK